MDIKQFEQAYQTVALLKEKAVGVLNIPCFPTLTLRCGNCVEELKLPEVDAEESDLLYARQLQQEEYRAIRNERNNIARSNANGLRNLLAFMNLRASDARSLNRNNRNNLNALSDAEFLNFVNRTLHDSKTQNVKNASLAAVDALDRGVCIKVDSDADPCVICQEIFQLEEKFIDMPCKHRFHEVCLLPWLKENNSCPSCRYEIDTNNSQYNQRLVQGRFEEEKKENDESKDDDTDEVMEENSDDEIQIMEEDYDDLPELENN
jgi:hypothetical protein